MDYPLEHFMRAVICWGLILASILSFTNRDTVGQGNAAQLSVESQHAFVNQYCAGCHNDNLKSGGFFWSALDLAHPEQNADSAERVIRKLRVGMMPPAG